MKLIKEISSLFRIFIDFALFLDFLICLLFSLFKKL